MIYQIDYDIDHLHQIDHLYDLDHEIDQIAYDIDQIERRKDQIDHLDPNLPLWDVVQDAHNTDPAQDTGPR